MHACARAGTLTQNRMAASALWVGGRQYNDLSLLLTPSAKLTYTGDGDSSPLGLDARLLGLLTDGVALNSTAELRAGDGAHLLSASSAVSTSLASWRSIQLCAMPSDLAASSIVPEEAVALETG